MVVINHLLAGMILQVWDPRGFFLWLNLNLKDWDQCVKESKWSQQHEERSDGGSCGHCVPRFFLVKAAWWNWCEVFFSVFSGIFLGDWLTISQLNIN